PGGRVTISVHSLADQVRIRVSDSGVGLESHEAQRIFQLFEQVNIEPSRSAGGLGIGLTVAKALVELHGGHITATSRGRGLGTQINVFLPRVLPAPLAPSSGLFR